MSTKRRYFLLVLAFLLPAAAFVNVWQVHRYRQLEQEIARLEERQLEIIEKNRRLIAGMSVYQSPGRLEELAKEELELQKLEPGRLILIERKEKDKEEDRD